MGKRSRESGLPREYEGEAILALLLEGAGSPLPVDEVKSRIEDAQGRKLPPAAVFPGFFEQEPRFASPDDALRLYSNLFGLWDRIAGGGPVEPVPTQPRKREKPPRAPRPAPPPEGPLSEEFVDAAWRFLADLEPREHQKLLHRYENTQPELSELVRAEAAGAISTLETADTLSFELWAMFDLARPERKQRPVSLKELKAALGEAETGEPALEKYIEQALAEAALEDENPLGPEEARQVRALARAVVRTLAQP